MVRLKEMKDEEYYQFTNSCYIKKASKSVNESAMLTAKEKSLALKEEALKSLEARLREKEKELQKREFIIKQKEEELSQSILK